MRTPHSFALVPTTQDMQTLSRARHTPPNQTLSSLAASPSPPGRSRGRVVKRRAVGGEGLANFVLDHVFLEC